MLLRQCGRFGARDSGAKSVAVWLLQTAARFAAAADAVASGAERRDAAPAAEYRRGGGGRFLQHGASTMRAAGRAAERRSNVLNSGLLNNLQKRFQVRLYKLSDHLDRIHEARQLNSSGQSTHIGDSLKQVLADAASLPIGAVVLLSDGADNSGGIDLETISGNPPPAHSGPHHRIRARKDGPRRRNERRADAAARAARFATVGAKSASISTATPGRKPRSH